MLSTLWYLSNRPQVSVGYKLVNHVGCWYNPQLIDQSERAHWFGHYINNFIVSVPRVHSSNKVVLKQPSCTCWSHGLFRAKLIHDILQCAIFLKLYHYLFRLFQLLYPDMAFPKLSLDNKLSIWSDITEVQHDIITLLIGYSDLGKTYFIWNFHLSLTHHFMYQCIFNLHKTNHFKSVG